MGSSPPSPAIRTIAWGRIDVDGLGRHRDVKLWPGGGREWDWRETGTHHDPGVQIADVAELLEHGCDVVVLGRGMHRRLQVREDTLELLRERGVECHAGESRDAVRRYNRLAEDGRRVGGLFHSTC